MGVSGTPGTTGIMVFPASSPVFSVPSKEPDLMEDAIVLIDPLETTIGAVEYDLLSVLLPYILVL